MSRLTMMCLDAAVSGLILSPIFLYMNRRYFHNIRRSINYLFLAVYLSAIFSVVGLPDICYIRFSMNMNLRPFAYMFSDYGSSLLNVLLFIPLGFMLPCFFEPFQKLWKMLLFGFSASLFIEFFQIFTYRASDVNDLMTNTFGTLLGWILARIFLLCFPSVKSSKDTKDLYRVLAVTVFSMVFIHPVLTKWLWA